MDSTSPGISHLLTSVGIFPNRESDFDPNSTAKSLILIYSTRSRIFRSSSAAYRQAQSSLGPVAVGPHNFPNNLLFRTNAMYIKRANIHQHTVIPTNISTLRKGLMKEHINSTSETHKIYISAF